MVVSIWPGSTAWLYTPALKHHRWLTVVAPWWLNNYCDFCVWVDRQCDVIIIISRPRTWYCSCEWEKKLIKFLLFSLFCYGTVVRHLWQFRCIFIAWECILVSSKISLDKLAFLAKSETRLEQWRANSGPRAKCGPPQRFQWLAQAFTKFFKSEIFSNSTQQTLVLRLTWTEICLYFQKFWPSADRGLLKVAPEPH